MIHPNKPIATWYKLRINILAIISLHTTVYMSWKVFGFFSTSKFENVPDQDDFIWKIKYTIWSITVSDLGTQSVKKSEKVLRIHYTLTYSPSPFPELNVNNCNWLTVAFLNSCNLFCQGWVSPACASIRSCLLEAGSHRGGKRVHVGGAGGDHCRI